MVIECIDNKIICIAEDWKKLETSERGFLAECYWTAIWTGFTEDGNLMFNDSGSALDKQARVNRMLYYANAKRIEVSESVRVYLKSLEGKANEERERIEFAKVVELKRERWEDRKKRGCELCRYSIKGGDGDFYCEYSGDYLDFRFSQIYNPVIKAMELFHEVGMPNNHCKDYFNEIDKKGERA